MVLCLQAKSFIMRKTNEDSYWVTAILVKREESRNLSWVLKLKFCESNQNFIYKLD